MFTTKYPNLDGKLNLFKQIFYQQKKQKQKKYMNNINITLLILLKKKIFISKKIIEQAMYGTYSLFFSFKEKIYVFITKSIALLQLHVDVYMYIYISQ